MGARRDNFGDSRAAVNHIATLAFSSSEAFRGDNGDMGTARPGDVLSLSEFKRRTRDLIDRLRKTGRPVILTINGKDALVVQDAAAYQSLLDRVEAIEQIRRGLADVKAGRAKPARQVFARLLHKHGVPSREKARRTLGEEADEA